jgi:hypothetical protein
MTSFSKLGLRIHRVKCVDETGGNRFTELGEDDIYLGATMTDMAARTVAQVPYFKVGGFDDGDVKIYNPPRQILAFNLTDGRPLPRGFGASLVLVERDSGDQMGPFLEELAAREREQLRSAFSAFKRSNNREPSADEGESIWREAWESFVKPALKEWWRSVQKDDIFEPIAVSLQLSSLRQIGAPASTITYKGHSATYTISYDWELVS